MLGTTSMDHFIRIFHNGKGFDFTSIIRAEVFIYFLAQRMMAASPDAPRRSLHFFTFSQDTHRTFRSAQPCIHHHGAFSSRIHHME